MNTIETDWTVITGAPSSGKTSLFTVLDALGMPTNPEAATICIERMMKENGKTKEQICCPCAQGHLQKEILIEGLKAQESSDPLHPYFFDRSVIDSIAYCKLYNLDETEFIQASQQYRFKRIFQLERVPLVENHVRIENDGMASRLDGYLTEAYEQLNYDVIRVPVMDIRKRVNFILNVTQ